MSDPFLYEFLFRGRPPGDPELPAWHVVIGQYVSLPGSEPQFVSSGPLTPEKAQAAGFPLDVVIGDLATAAMVGRDALAAELATARQERDAAVERADALEAQLDAIQAERETIATAAVEEQV
ncbi:hypothetical protein [Methylobacterium sp. ID0610]|uniref:hypothetical protein n=1 Tax=Methylobacterium carpenticola TaxID=3344827 RepID=UPI0036B97C93